MTITWEKHRLDHSLFDKYPKILWSLINIIMRTSAFKCWDSLLSMDTWMVCVCSVQIIYIYIYIYIHSYIWDTYIVYLHIPGIMYTGVWMNSFFMWNSLSELYLHRWNTGAALLLNNILGACTGITCKHYQISKPISTRGHK